LAVEQTKAVFEPLRLRILDAAVKLEDAILASEEGGAAPAGELDEAKSVLAQSKAKQNGS
jgi:tubulin-specific chaperone A